MVFLLYFLTGELVDSMSGVSAVTSLQYTEHNGTIISIVFHEV